MTSYLWHFCKIKSKRMSKKHISQDAQDAFSYPVAESNSKNSLLSSQNVIKLWIWSQFSLPVLIVVVMGMSKESIILAQTSIIVVDWKEQGRFKMAVLRTDTMFPSMWNWAKQVTGLIFNSTELQSARLLCLEEKWEILSYKYWWLSGITTLEETMGFN